MSHTANITWSCDRCGRSVAVEQTDAPWGWANVSAVSVTNDGEPARLWEICNGCYSQVERLLMNQKDVTNAA